MVYSALEELESYWVVVLGACSIYNLDDRHIISETSSSALSSDMWTVGSDYNGRFLAGLFFSIKGEDR
jgi:hypothetical protein